MLSEKIKKIPPSGIRKFFDLATQVKDIISLGVGEPDFATPWHITEHGIYHLEKNRINYTSNYGILELRQEISRNLQKEYQVKYNPQREILVTVGVSQGLDLAVRALINPGDEVIITDPCYVSYEPNIILSDGKPVIIETTPRDNFILDVKKLEKAITPRTKVLILSYPSNPTGAVAKKNTLEEIAKIVRNNNLIVISDEIYHKLTYEDEHTCFASLPGMKQRTILLNGFSKTYAMTGWRLGFACAPKEIIEGMLKIHQYVMMCAPTTSQKAAIEALKNGAKDVEMMKEEYEKRRNFVASRLKEMGITTTYPQGAFYIFPSVKKFNLSSEEFCLRLLKEEKVVVVPGNVFGKCGEGHIRISYASSLSSLKIALDRIEKFINKL